LYYEKNNLTPHTVALTAATGMPLGHQRSKLFTIFIIVGTAQNRFVRRATNAQVLADGMLRLIPVTGQVQDERSVFFFCVWMCFHPVYGCRLSQSVADSYLYRRNILVLACQTQTDFLI
jgi:hypothetical protein